ncbi:keto-hydroxyglutarate-aldolase/keto-deoxy-phosphogluconate aldolase [Fulvimarina pelagi HTCC2506]|uniref:2-dehydro-3-deoxy-phosphogluconate aldolase n=1 Tax=Fulvimarina pelagi HTCC2506 TaxID=314231 RepID=Q0G6U1_9HYPH|nr:bifunctional 4-hydroxy-2-oxoglutarate aldolase/2-dehydro-3-deoxy-phosphogluconate aldolase [Fulvimarina pelagi]EAU42623.1 keto-hydroxyglutarate-aldolase/keto-deoxy-phosphogluconate aldolase [Fulvimarina pelagi HTCC2506]
MQKTDRLLQILTGQAVIPVVAVDSIQEGVGLARALAKGGLKAIEVTLRTPAALEAIEAIVVDVPEAICGAGTILKPDDYTNAVKAGAKFIVSPGATVELLDTAKKSAIPFLPGSATPSELLAMLQEGYEVLKFFPAEQSGGLSYLRSLAPVFQGVKFCPTGGVSPDNARDYLALPNVVCVGGSWVAPKALIKDGAWDEITKLAAEAAGLSAD